MSSPLSAYLVVQRDFFDRAGEMRAEFEARVGPDRTFSPTRLVWDYWYVEGQYAYFRCPARHFFSPNLYRTFVAAMREWGGHHLGCSECSEFWFSYYIDGCHQNFHTDVGQGPWAVVFSLTVSGVCPFSGGETALLRPATLDYWRHFRPDYAVEHDELLQYIPSVFNQLIVFDARVPHAVTAVRGTHDPLLSRVVLHGWFRAPFLAVRGSLEHAQVQLTAEAIADSWNTGRQSWGAMHGVVTLRLTIAATGTVDGVVAVATTLVSLETPGAAIGEAIALAIDVAGAATFPASAGASEVLLPLSAEYQ